MTNSLLTNNNGNQNQQYLLIPNPLTGFTNTYTEETLNRFNRSVYILHGNLDIDDVDRTCQICGSSCHINGQNEQRIHHLPTGPNLTEISFYRTQFFCPTCGRTHMQQIPFKDENHRITQQLYNYICDLLADGYTNKKVSTITGLSTFLVKQIDIKRLKGLYMRNDKLIVPTSYSEFLGIDEFLLHENHKYATHIIDLMTGHVLWIAQGKKKQVVYDFIEHVGLDWMKHVTAVAMDMNSDFQEAFQDTCPHINIVFDRFHIIKNFNEKVISEVRKDEQRRLLAEGDIEGAKSLKRSKFILTSSKNTLKRRDAEYAKKHNTSPSTTLDTHSDAASHIQSDVVSDIQSDAVSDTQSGVVSDTQSDAVSDTQSDVVSDTQSDAASNMQSDTVSDTQSDAASKKSLSPSERYESLIKNNQLLFTADLVREKLNDAYSLRYDPNNSMTDDELTAAMKQGIDEIIEICKSTQNPHFIKFGKLLASHYQGIINHANYPISSGKVEGLNNKIKTLRRQAYGIPDDQYLFLKVMDASRHK